MASNSTTTFSFAFKVSPPIARSSTTSLRTSPTIVRLSQFTKKTSLNLSSSHTISGFSPILPRLTFPTQSPQSLTVVSAKGYKMKTHKASAKRFRVTGSGKIMRRRAGKPHLLRKKNTKRKLRLTALDCGYKLDSSFQPSQPSPTSVSPSANTKAYVDSTSNSGSQQSDSNWFLDSDATSHMTNDLSNLSFYQPYQGHDLVAIGDGTTLPIAHTGNGLLSTPFPFHLTNMLHVPTLSSNLLSVHHLAVDNNGTITFDEDSFLVQDKSTREC